MRTSFPVTSTETDLNHRPLKLLFPYWPQIILTYGASMIRKNFNYRSHRFRIIESQKLSRYLFAKLSKKELNEENYNSESVGSVLKGYKAKEELAKRMNGSDFVWAKSWIVRLISGLRAVHSLWQFWRRTDIELNQRIGSLSSFTSVSIEDVGVERTA